MVPRWDALIFDVDGTLYRAGKLRAHVAIALALHALRSPRLAPTTVAVIRAYRHSLEALRGQRVFPGSVRDAQLEETMRRTGLSYENVGAIVDRWFLAVPARTLVASRRMHLISCLNHARARGIRLGVVSDYEPMRKLEALGVASFFDVIVHADDPEVRSLKPSPRGIQVALQRMNVAPSRAAYVGDRLDIDVPAAIQAGVTPVLLGRRGTPGAIRISGFDALSQLVGARAIESD